MPLFDTNAERMRKHNLKTMEDKRLRFAEELHAKGFAPEKMIFFSNEGGNFVALSRWNGKYAVIVSPVFGQEGEFHLELHDELHYEREDVFQKGTGLNGAFGFGTKGARGFNLHISLNDGSTAEMQVVAGRTSWLEAPLKKNPLLSAKRRRGDANIVWDLMPIEHTNLSKIEDKLLRDYIG